MEHPEEIFCSLNDLDMLLSVWGFSVGCRYEFLVGHEGTSTLILPSFCSFFIVPYCKMVSYSIEFYLTNNNVYLKFHDVNSC